MPSAGVVGAAQSNDSASSGGAVIPFEFATTTYADIASNGSVTFTLGTTQQQFNNNKVPALGFMRGIRYEVTSTGGSGGTGSADWPWNIFVSLEFDGTNGAPIFNPMPGWEWYAWSKWFRPWMGDPTKRANYSNNVTTPSFTLFHQNEIRRTLGTLRNTDARSQYTFKFTTNTLANTLTSGTSPTFTLNPYRELYLENAAEDLEKNAQEQLPIGLNGQVQTEICNPTSGGANSSLKYYNTNTGNYQRGNLIIFRDSNNARQDFFAGNFIFQQDNTQLISAPFSELVSQMNDFYDQLAAGLWVRDTGTVVLPRFWNPGAEKGMGWLGTSAATQQYAQFQVASGATNVPGVIEFITDEVYPVADGIPQELMDL